MSVDYEKELAGVTEKLEVARLENMKYSGPTPPPRMGVSNDAGLIGGAILHLTRAVLCLGRTIQEGAPRHSPPGEWKDE